MCIEANTAALAFEERTSFIATGTCGDRRPSSNLFPKSGIQANFYELGENGLVCRYAGGTGFKRRALELGIYGKIWEEASAVNLLGSERVLAFKFQSCLHSLVPGFGGHHTLFIISHA